MQPRDGVAPDRTPIELIVRYQRINSFFSDYVKNISRGGTFVATDEPLPADTELDFLLGIPALDEPLALRGRVVWCTSPEAATSAQPAGMGIRFQYGDPVRQAHTEALIERLLVEHLGPLHAERLLRHPIEEPVIG